MADFDSLLSVAGGAPSDTVSVPLSVHRGLYEHLAGKYVLTSASWRQITEFDYHDESYDELDRPQARRHCQP